MADSSQSRYSIGGPTTVVSRQPTAGSTDQQAIKIKIIIVGASAVGKSCLLIRFTDDMFDEAHSCTIGVDLKYSKREINGKAIDLVLWDTAGNETFRSLSPAFYRKSQGVIFVYDVSSERSFQDLDYWLKECDSMIGDTHPVRMLIGNKIDLTEQRVVSRDQGLRFARDHSMMYIEASAKTSEGVQIAFDELVMKILDRPDLWVDHCCNRRDLKRGLAGYDGRNNTGWQSYMFGCC